MAELKVGDSVRVIRQYHSRYEIHKISGETPTCWRINGGLYRKSDLSEFFKNPAYNTYIKPLDGEEWRDLRTWAAYDELLKVNEELRRFLVEHRDDKSLTEKLESLTKVIKDAIDNETN